MPRDQTESAPLGEALNSATELQPGESRRMSPALRRSTMLAACSHGFGMCRKISEPGVINPGCDVPLSMQLIFSLRGC